MASAQGRIAICNGCGEEKLIVYGWSTREGKLCQTCEWAKQKEKKLSKTRVFPQKTKPFAPKITGRLKEKRKTDAEVNAKIWASRPHVCFESGEPLGNKPEAFMFSHVLSKGAHPELRHDPNNIVLHSFESHQKWEFGKNRESMETFKKKREYIETNGRNSRT